MQVKKGKCREWGWHLACAMPRMHTKVKDGRLLSTLQVHTHSWRRVTTRRCQIQILKRNFGFRHVWHIGTYRWLVMIRLLCFKKLWGAERMRALMESPGFQMFGEIVKRLINNTLKVFVTARAWNQHAMPHNTEHAGWVPEDMYCVFHARNIFDANELLWKSSWFPQNNKAPLN